MRAVAIVLIASPLPRGGCARIERPFMAKSRAQLIASACTWVADQGRSVTGLTLTVGRDGKAVMGLKGVASQGILSMGAVVDINLDYTLSPKRLALTSMGGKVDKLSANDEAVDLATMRGAEAVEKKMALDMKKDDAKIEALDAQQLVLKPKDGGALACKNPAA